MGRETSKAEIEKLVLQAKKGDTAAFSKLYDCFADGIYRYVFFRVTNEQDAQDLTETVFLKSWENLHKYKNDGDNSSFNSWIFRIAHNLVIDHYRLNKQIESLTEDYMDERTGRHPFEKAEKSLNNDLLKKALGGLKENYKQIIVLKYINELSNEEIAGILKRNEGSVRILQFRALKALKRILEGMGVRGI